MKDLYITIDGTRVELKKFDAKIGDEINRGIAAGNVVFEVNSSYWSGTTNNLPEGIQAVYFSGSHTKIPIAPGSAVSVAGEVAMFRTDNGQQKAYRNLLVISGSNNWYYGEQFKDFSEHHYSGNPPTGTIWSKPHPKWPST